MESGVIDTLDRDLFLLLNFDGGKLMDGAMLWASDKLIWAPLYLLMIFLLWRKYGWKRCLLAFVTICVTVVVADQICNIFKTYTPRLRPMHNPDLKGSIHTLSAYTGGLYGTVSAHAATITSIAVFSSMLISRRWWRNVMIVWTALVCYSRIYLGAHYPQDIFYGILLGFILGSLAVLMWRRFAKVKK